MNPNPSEKNSAAKPDVSLTRRRLLQLAATGVIGGALGVGGSAGIAWWSRAPAPPYLFFTPAEAKLLMAICEQIIPRDDAPGATDAGVIFYIDRQLCGPFLNLRQTYRTGLESIRKSCQHAHQKSFEQLEFAQQTAFLHLIEGGKAPKEFWSDPTQQAFFNLLIDHTRQGFYGSPRHGGNRDYVSYRMLGLAYPNLIGQNRYASRRSS